MKYEDSCGFCAPFSSATEEDSGSIVQSSSQKFSDIVESISKGGSKVLEVILEQREEEDSACEKPQQPSSTAATTTVDEASHSSQKPRDLNDQSGNMKTFIDAALTAAPMFGIKSPVANAASPTNLAASPRAPTSPGGTALAGFSFQEGFHKELDFDVNPSEVYLLLQRRDWNGAVQRVKSHPEEATYWISRKEADGKLRWRLLPIHGAIIFCAPDTTVKSLIEAFPDSASAKDDQGMLPLHLSYRMGSPAPVIEVLLKAFPESLTVKDRKGRTPVVMAQTAKGPNRAVFLRAIEKTQQEQLQKQQAAPAATSSPKAVATASPPVDAPSSIQVPTLATPTSAVSKAVATATLSAAPELASTSVSAKSRAEYEAQIKQLQKEHADQMEALKKDAEKAKHGLEDEVANLKADLASAEEASQVLSEHVATLERRLKQEEETQTHLASKIAMLDTTVKSTMSEKNETEGKLIEERDALIAKRHGLEASLEVFRSRNDELEKALSETKAHWEKDYKELEKKFHKLSQDHDELHRDYEGVSSNVRLLDGQLKKKMIHEQKLVKQVSELARQLTEATEDNEKATIMFTKGIGELQKERDDLRKTISGLSMKLMKVVGSLEELSKKQDGIAAKAAAQEKEILDASSLHDRIMSEFKAQQDLHDKARREREQIAQVLRQQEQAFGRSEEDRVKMVEAMNEYGAKIEVSGHTRHEITEGTTSMKNQIEAVIRSVAGTLPNGVDARDDLDKFVDHVVQTVLSKHDDGQESIEPTESQILGTDDTFTLYVPKNHAAQDLDEVEASKSEEHVVEEEEEEVAEAEDQVQSYQLHDEKKEDGTEGIEIGI